MSTAIVAACYALAAATVAWAARAVRRMLRDYRAKVERDRRWDEEHPDA